MEAYILVRRMNFTYMDVKSLTRSERVTFIKFYQEELEQEREAMKDAQR